MSFSTVRRLTAWGIVLTIVCSLVLPALSARHLTPDADDVLVIGVQYRVDQIGPVGWTPADEHCAVCHWLSAISGASIQAAVSPAAWLAFVTAPVVRPSARQGGSAVPAGPSRAPPASPTPNSINS